MNDDYKLESIDWENIESLVEKVRDYSNKYFNSDFTLSVHCFTDGDFMVESTSTDLENNEVQRIRADGEDIIHSAESKSYEQNKLENLD